MFYPRTISRQGAPKNRTPTVAELLELPEDSGSLLEHLYAIYVGDRPMPVSDARRQHFVPQMLQAPFTTDTGAGAPKLWKLDKTTGTCDQVTTNGAAWERNLYTAYDASGKRYTQMESYFGLVESHAAGSLTRLIADPMSLEFGDRVNISMFVTLQEQRTPVALDVAEEMIRQAGTMFAITEMGKARGRRHRLRQAREALVEGRVTLAPPPALRLKMLMESVLEIAPEVHYMNWQLQHATSGEFVLSDCPLTMRDPAPRHPWTGNAWMSSENAYVTLPLGPQHCLRLDHLVPLGLEVRDVERQVTATNLRTYGWATRYILGRSKDVLVDLHALACAEPNRVPTPKPRRLVMLEDPETAGPADAERNRARGWPETVVHAPPDAPPRELSYRVIESEEDVRDSMRPRPVRETVDA